jgi:hypothetical protein
VIKVGMLARIRRMHFRDHLLLREIARQTRPSRNTISIGFSSRTPSSRSEDSVLPECERSARRALFLRVLAADLQLLKAGCGRFAQPSERRLTHNCCQP